MTDEGYEIFISHNSQDKDLIVQILERLYEYDIRTWLDKWDLRPAHEWAPAIEEALQSCDSCAVFLGANGWGQHHLAEARLALGRKEQRPDFKVIPVLLPGAREDDINVLGNLFSRQHRVDFTNGPDDEEAFRRLLAAIRGEAPGPPPLTVFTIKRDAAHWHQLPGRDKPSILYRGAELRKAQALTRLHPEKLSDLAQQFLLESEVEEQRQLDRERTRNRRIIFGLTAGLISISVAALYAQDKRREAVAQRDKAAERLVAQRVRNGTRAAVDGDLWGAWSWYANALQLARQSNLDERAHRERLGGLRWLVPHLRELWYAAEKSPAAVVSPDAEMVAINPDIYSSARAGAGSVAIELLRVKDGARLAEIQLGSHYLLGMVFSPRGDELWTLQSGFDESSRERRFIVAIHGLPSAALKASREITVEHARSLWLDRRKLALIDYKAAHIFQLKDSAIEVDTIDGLPDAYVRAVSTDGNLCAAYSHKNNKLLIRPKETPWAKAAAVDFANSPTDVFFSPNGKHLITIEDRALAVWRLDGKPQKVAEAELEGSVAAHQFDREGRLLLTESRGRDSHVSTLWKFENATLLKSFDHEKILSRWEFPADPSGGGGTSFGAGAAVGFTFVNPFERHAVLSDDGQRLITVSKNTRSYRVWDIATGDALTAPISHGGSELLSVCFSSDGRTVVSSARDGTTKLWDVSLPRRFKPLIGQPSPVTALRFLGGGDRLLSISGARARLLDWSSGREVAALGEKLEAAALTGGGRMIAGLQSDKFRLWNAETFAPVADWLSHPSVNGVTVSENGLYAASWDTHSNAPTHVRLWNLQQEKLVDEIIPGERPLVAVCIDERQKIALMVLYTKEWRGHDLVVYDLETKETSRPQGFQTFGFEGLFYGENEGSWMGFDGQRFWRLARPDLDRPQPYSTSTSSLTKYLTATADGTRAVLADGEGLIAQVIDVRTGAPLTPEFRHEWKITNAQINPEGTRLLTVSGNKAHLWDITTGDALVPVIRYPQTVTASALHPAAGTFAVSAEKEVGDNRFAIFVESLAAETADPESLVAYGEVNGEQRVDAVGARLPLSARELATTWLAIRRRTPAVVRELIPEVAWYRQLEAESGRYIGQQLYYLDKILERVSEDTYARLERAELHEIAGDDGAAVADLLHLIEFRAFDAKLDLTLESIHRYCRLLFLKDRPRDAFRVLREQSVPSQGKDGWLIALVSFAAEELAVYRQNCDSMSRWSKVVNESDSPWEEKWNSAFYTAHACMLSEDTRPQFSAAVALAAAAGEGHKEASETLRLLRGADALNAGSLSAAEESLRGLEGHPLGKLLTADLLIRRGESARARVLVSEMTGELGEWIERGDSWLEATGLKYLNRTMEVRLETR